jgi:hypothetical protein
MCIGLIVFAHVGVAVSIEQSVTQSDPTSTTPIVFDVQFAEDVLNFDSGDVTLESTSGEPLSGVVSAVSGSQYSVTVSPVLAGVITATIAGGVAKTTGGSYENHASTSADNRVTYDTLSALSDDVAAIEVKLDDEARCKTIVKLFKILLCV